MRRSGLKAREVQSFDTPGVDVEGAVAALHDPFDDEERFGGEREPYRLEERR